MLISVRLIDYTNSRGQIRKRNVYTYSCDECQIEFQKRKKLNYERCHFCSLECCRKSRKKTGALNRRLEATNLSRYGVKRPMQCDSIKETYRKTSLMNHGVENPMLLESIKVRNHEHMRKTFNEKYGVEHPLQVKEIAQKAHEAAKLTRIDRYGVEHIAHIPGHLQKREATNIKRYGFKNPNSNSAIQAKAKITREKKGITFCVSKIELTFFEWLKTCFNDVKHIKWINKHPVDFYIVDIDTYVEFDGEFWHGHDPKNRLKYSWIAKNFERDREQDRWFKENDLRLVRITDREFRSMPKEQILDRIKFYDY